MFSPEMMEAAQKMMSNMKPDDMQRMSQMAANMDPKMMENMMKNMGHSGFDASQASQAAEQMKSMSPDQLQAGMTQAQQQMNAQKQYMCNAAEMLKNEGNTHVKNERYGEALTKYSKALDNLKSHSGADVTQLRLSLLNNSALCHLKTKAFGEAVSASEEALQVDPKNFKALFRRGQARAALGKLSEALLDVKKASELQPSDKAISNELAQLRVQLKERGINEESLSTKHEVSDAWQSPTPPTASASPRSSSSSSSAAAGGDSGRWAKAASTLAENPDMLKQATEAMSKMKPEDMERMMSSTPLPPGMDASMMKSQMEQLQKNPDMLKNAMESLQALPEEDRKKMLAMRCGSLKGDGGAEAVSAMFDNPDTIQQAVEMAKGLSDEDHPEAESMRKAAEQMASNPDLAKQMSNMVKNMSPDQLQSMMELSGRMRGKPGGVDGSDGVGEASSSTCAAPNEKDMMASMMNDPDMMKATEDMMKNMSPEMLASMAKASGLDLDEGKAKMVARFLPWLLKLMRLFGYLKKAWSAAFSRRGRFILAGSVVMIAMLQHYRE